MIHLKGNTAGRVLGPIHSLQGRMILAMKFPSGRRAIQSSVAVALASSHLALPSYFGHPLLVTSFSLNIQPTRAKFSSSTTAQAMSKMNQSFDTWSFDEPCTSMAWTDVPESTLEISSDVGSLTEDADLIIVGVFGPKKSDDDSEDEKDKDPSVELEGEAKALDEKLGGALSSLMLDNFKDFKNGATAGSTTPTVRTFVDGKFQRYAVMGLGEKEAKEGLLGVGSAVGKGVGSLSTSEKKVEKTKVLLPEAVASSASFLTDASAAFYAALYADNRFRTGDAIKKPAEDLKSVTFVGEGSMAEGAVGALESGKKLALGIYMARDIVNAPHNVLNSLSLAETAKRIAAESGGCITCTVLGKKECEERGMGAFLGVARASETEPQFIHLQYKPPSGEVKSKIGVIGKGLLFDTGGYNIKTQMMELMKFDCGGAAAVLGAARAVGALQPEGVEANFVVAACENMISGKGVVPSDILTASNGKTIEVLNTDAEGRLTLADALVYCDKELDCESVIELSTLTGACMIALGKNVAGVWTDNDDLAGQLADISKETEEKSWRMPMEKSYNEQLKSKVADLQNIGTRYGGAITAALFLQNFIDKKKPFAHIDIAGPVWDDKSGATGYGSKLVTEWVRRQGDK